MMGIQLQHTVAWTFSNTEKTTKEPMRVNIFPKFLSLTDENNYVLLMQTIP